jgi:hypothetical protein
MLNKKAQIITTDFFIGFGLFIILAIIIAVFLSIYQINLANNLEYNNMLSKSLHATEMLTRTPGYPINWTNDTVIIPGLISTDRNLSEHKMNMLFNTSIPDLKRMFKTSQYNISIVLKYTDGSDIESLSDIGEFKKVALARGFLIYNGTNTTTIEVKIVR